MPITPTQMKLGEEYLAKIDKLAERYGLASRTAAVKLAVNIALTAEVRTPKQKQLKQTKVKK